jgi:hypothetical protein
MPIVGAALIYRLRPRLNGWAILAVIPIVPMADALTNAAAGFPLWVALNTRLGYGWTYPVGTVTCLLAVLVVWVTAQAAGEPPATPAALSTLRRAQAASAAVRAGLVT